jgi:hypothetical protein
MKNLLDRLLAVACLGLVSISVPAYASTYTFSQTGFEDGGMVSGTSPAATWTMAPSPWSRCGRKSPTSASATPG